MATVKAIGTPGKGILAADESPGTLGSRFKDIAVEANDENSNAYRELLFTTPGLEQNISGVIMFDATARGSCKDGTKFCDVLNKKGIKCGIKVDTGCANIIGGTDGEKAT